MNAEWRGFFVKYWGVKMTNVQAAFVSFLFEEEKSRK
jgi:hypothetical protein